MALDDGEYDEAFAMRLVAKDLGLAVDPAREVGCAVGLPRWSSSCTRGCAD